MPSREDVRQMIVAAVETGYSGTVIAGRAIDARAITEFVNVFLESGEVEHGFGASSITTAEVSIGIHKQGATDADLDTIGDSITGAIYSDSALRVGLVGMMQTGFSYETGDNDGVNSLILKFEIKY